jgi:hypothetical protein
MSSAGKPQRPRSRRTPALRHLYLAPITARVRRKAEPAIRDIDATLESPLKEAEHQAGEQRKNDPLQTVEAQMPMEMAGWRDDVRRDPFDATDSAGYYWAKGNANREADVASPNVRHSFTLAAGSQQMPNKPFAFYQSASFRRVSCLVNLPGQINRPDPQLNGLVDKRIAMRWRR